MLVANKIKITILVILAFTLYSCSNDDDYTFKFNPPDWIIGKWIKADESNELNSITFTNNDVILELSSGSERSLSEFAENNDDGGIDVSEEINDSIYITILTYRIGGYQDTSIAKKLSENEILYNDENYIRK